MDPLSALSVAAAAVQFLDFAVSKCRYVKRLYDEADNGVLNNAAFKSTAEDFLKFSEALSNRQRFSSGSDGHAGEEAEDVGVHGGSLVAD